MYRDFDEWRAAVARDEDQFLRLTHTLARGLSGRRTRKLMRELRATVRACDSLAEAIKGKFYTRAGVAGMAALPGLSSQAEDLAGISARFAAWPELSRRLDLVLGEGPGPLFPALPISLTEEHRRTEQEDTAWLAVHMALQPVPGKFGGAGDRIHHADIPADMSFYLWLMRGAVRLSAALGRGRTFIDVGCGVGLKVLQAALMVHAADGLEYREDAAEIARRVVDHASSKRSRIFTADALNFDGYGDYDIVYCYKPLSDPDLMRELELRILAQVRPGTVLVLPYLEFLTLAEDLGCAMVIPRVYIAHATAAEAQQTLRKASRYRPGDQSPLPALPAQPGYLAPVWSALNARLPRTNRKG